MYNPPQEIDDYIQLSGRGGRDGTQSLSVIVKTSKKTGRSLSKDMQEFINTKACRREVLSAAFPGTPASRVLSYIIVVCFLSASKRHIQTKTKTQTGSGRNINANYLQTTKSNRKLCSLQ
ncbi:hypothetical protein HOLleu_43461 [Holothuria leucospilota]|uniref:Uncharacterized protein n=1 Tax=Holothuria leucospilota TaxID=206669 RepID=A0A9Q1BBK3_HOLLE|nr:hypothetical protein HOLleu_43461 [Holothuria leucospilota]